MLWKDKRAIFTAAGARSAGGGPLQDLQPKTVPAVGVPDAKRRRGDNATVTILIAPRAMRATTRPAVGIFWCVNGILVIDRSALDRAEPYGRLPRTRGGAL